MPRSPRQEQPTTWSRWSTPLLTLMALAVAGSLIWTQLPRGAYPTDLSRIGAGRPALVLAFDSNYAGGMAVMELMNTVRADYAERFEFLVAHLGLPEGQAFASRHAVGDGTVLLFAGDGSHVATVPPPRSAEELRQTLDAAFP